MVHWSISYIYKKESIIMFHLFGKKGSADPQSRIQLALEKQDYAELAQAYYDMGVSAMDTGVVSADPGPAGGGVQKAVRPAWV